MSIYVCLLKMSVHVCNQMTDVDVLECNQMTDVSDNMSVHVCSQMTDVGDTSAHVYNFIDTWKKRKKNDFI